MALRIEDAKREKLFGRFALISPSGGGKTHSALRLAEGLARGGKICVIDTEHNSSKLELGKPDIPKAFRHIQLDPPYTPEAYIEAIELAYKDGASVIIIDSLSHAWAGKGGIIEYVNKQSKNGNSFYNWRQGGEKLNLLVDALLSVQAHLIVTMRSKVEYVIEKDEKGGNSVRKLGLQPIMRDGVEYEFTIVWDLERDTHEAAASKDRSSLFIDETPRVLAQRDGERLAAWLDEGEAPAPRPEPEVKTAKSTGAASSSVARLTADQLEKLTILVANKGYKTLSEALKENGFNKDPEELTVEEGRSLAGKVLNGQ